MELAVAPTRQGKRFVLGRFAEPNAGYCLLGFRLSIRRGNVRRRSGDAARRGDVQAWNLPELKSATVEVSTGEAAYARGSWPLAEWIEYELDAIHPSTDEFEVKTYTVNGSQAPERIVDKADTFERGPRFHWPRRGGSAVALALSRRPPPKPNLTGLIRIPCEVE